MKLTNRIALGKAADSHRAQTTVTIFANNQGCKDRFHQPAIGNSWGANRFWCISVTVDNLSGPQEVLLWKTQT